MIYHKNTIKASFKMSRWVERNGLRVEFSNVVGAHVGSTYYYQFPTEQLAKEFEVLAKTSDKNGGVSAINPEIWGKFRVSSNQNRVDSK